MYFFKFAAFLLTDIDAHFGCVPTDIKLGGPIYSYSDGKGNDFNISLMVKAQQSSQTHKIARCRESSPFLVEGNCFCS